MSWLYSQALVAEYLGANCLDGEPSALLSGSPTPQAYLSSDRMTAFSRPSRFGMTFGPLTDALGAELLTWFLEASRARTSALQEKAQESLGRGVACGVTWRASLAKFDPDSSLWKTAQLSLLEDSELSSVTWPRSGMTAGGLCWELPTLKPPTSVTDSGLWPTPTVCGNYNRKGASTTSGDGLATAVKNWPTPTASLGTKGGRVTPRKSREGGTLIEAVSARTFATPTARDWRSGKASQATHDKNSRPLSEQIGGSLNPTWVEWLMGWPIGHTELKPLAMDRFREWRQQHTECLEVTE